MGRKKNAKAGGSAILYSKSKSDGDESASLRRDGGRTETEDFLELEESKRSDASEEESDEDDEEVFDLAQDGSSDSESEKGSDSHSESGSGSSDEESDDETDTKGSTEAAEDTENLKSLVDNLPANLRQKVLLGQTDFQSDDEDSDGDDDEEDGGKQGFSGISWGKKKSYYTGDTADLEIGQEMEDAIDEEEAALSLQKQRLQGMRESDFTGDDYDVDNDDEDAEDEGESSSKKDQKKKKGKSAKSPFMDSLESVALEENVMDISDISRDKKKMSKRQRLEMLASELPELIGLSQELVSFSNDIFSDLSDLRAFLDPSDYGSTPSEELFAHYLEAKMTLYHSYSTNVVFAMYLRAAGKNLRTHPVMKQLLEHQYAIRNLAKVDKYYRDEYRSLCSLMASAPQASPDELNRILNHRRGSDEDDDDSSEDKHGASDDEKDGESDGEGEDMDEEGESDENDDANMLDEEETFNRLDGSVVLKRKRTSGRSHVPASADFGEYEEADEKLGLNVSKSRAGAPSLKSSLQGFVQARNKSTKSLHGLDDQLGELGKPAKAANVKKDDSSDESDDDDGGDNEDSSESAPAQDDIEALRALLRGVDPAKAGKRERRKAPDESMYGDGDEMPHGSEGEEEGDDDDQEDDGANLYEAFAGAKQRYMAKKKLHYTPAPRYGGFEQTVEEGGKRGASYEIIKNKGLTPHRKKANRNPRVKKRQMYAKAVIARKGQVREVITPTSAAYGGESTGIKANLSKGRKIKT